jgi:hypothetical protein
VTCKESNDLSTTENQSKYDAPNGVVMVHFQYHLLKFMTVSFWQGENVNISNCFNHSHIKSRYESWI